MANCASNEAAAQQLPQRDAIMKEAREIKEK
jgi:hypothetical protein